MLTGWRARSRCSRLLALAIAGAFAVVAAPPAAACSCAPSSSVGEAVSSAGGAFIGTLVAKDPDPRPPPGAVAVPLGPPVLHHFVVERVVKGDIGSTVSVRASTVSFSCGLELATGDRVGLLLEGGPPSEWSAGSCNQVGLVSLQQFADRQTLKWTPLATVAALVLGVVALAGAACVRR